MDMPGLAIVVRVVAVIGAVIGCLQGAGAIIASLFAFQYGFWVGLGAIATGCYIILGSLALVGFVHCFLALVEANIDTRNDIHEMLRQQRR